jgi:hypothetical protein
VFCVSIGGFASADESLIAHGESIVGHPKFLAFIQQFEKVFDHVETPARFAILIALMACPPRPVGAGQTLSTSISGSHAALPKGHE